MAESALASHGARNIPLEAAYLREGLHLGVANMDDVVLWSDGVIAESDVAEEPFVDLSFAHKLHPLTVMGKLESLSLEVAVLDVLPALLGLAHKKLTADPEYGKGLARALYQIYVNCGFNIPKELHDIGWFDDAYDLASTGLSGTEEGVFEHLLQFTGKFEERANAAGLPAPLKMDSRLRGNDKL